MARQLIKMNILQSLKARLTVSALLMILVLMPLIGFTLNDAFKQQAKSAVKNELSAYVYSVLAVAEVDNNQLFMPEQLLENQFNVIQSGLYALISTIELNGQSLTETELVEGVIPPDKTGQNIAWHSDSFIGYNIPQYLPYPTSGESEFSEIELDGHYYLIYSFSARFEQTQSMSFPVTIHIIKDKTVFQQQISEFTKQLWTWLLTLMVFLVVVQLSWLLWTLKPLEKFAREVTDIEQGKSTLLHKSYPNELQVVANKVNTLLNTEQSQRKRYRNALSDLAHSLKTPLAVIQSQPDLSESSVEQVDIINRIIGHQLKRAQSSAGASWYLGIKITSVSDKLVRVLTKLYQQPKITIIEEIDDKAVFKGDQADLSEILGNLLDNACKAARNQVLLSAYYSESSLIITVEDDGEGLSSEQQKRIFERGVRVDSYKKGHGIGLAIVADLIDSYKGNLSVSTSDKLGGAKFTCRFGFTVK